MVEKFDMWKLGQFGVWTLNREPIETLVERLRAIREGRYPTISHKARILQILSRRVPLGFIIVYDEKIDG